MSHFGTEFFAKAKEANDKGIDNLYMYGIHYLKIHYGLFHKQFHHTKLPYTPEYIPNPFRFQYDLTVFLWLNYYKIVDKEIEELKRLYSATGDNFYQSKADQTTISRLLNGITRADFLFMASELRWPTNILEDGSHHGLLVRDPWSERRIESVSNEKIKYLLTFGGGGQGKTLVSLGIALIVFDYYLFTLKGARCMLSTVNKDKMNSVGWPYLCNLNSSTIEGISLTAGRAKIAGDHTLSRPGNKDRGGVFKGILIGNQMNRQTIVDKLTGSHGHPFIVYIMDEMQSTPDPPIMAAPNYTMHAGDYRIIGSGNWGENDDTLAKNVKPDIGWDHVDEKTGHWISTTQNQAKAIVLHFNNDLSPGMEPEGHKKFPHLPSQQVLDRNYPNKSKRNSNDISYRRFWIGFRVEASGELYVIYDTLVKENMADLPLNLDRLDHTFFTFDSAQAEIDRNCAIVFREGICSVTKQRVFGPHKINLLNKATESTKYYEESSDQLLDIARKNNIISGAGVVDWTGRPAQAEILQRKGFLVRRLIYNKGVPDGIRRDKHTKRIEKAINLDIKLDFKQDILPEKLCAHHVAENMISLGAWALREYVKNGRVRGINGDLIRFIQGEKSLEDELFNRKFYLKNSAIYGSRFQLESKDDFKTKYGFSPDILDCLFEAAWYMLLYRKFPLTPAGNDVIVSLDKKSGNDQEDHSELWERDLIS